MAKERQLKEGDLVQLRSGGPVMTLLCILSDHQSRKENGLEAACGWFPTDGAETMSEARIPVEALKLASESS